MLRLYVPTALVVLVGPSFLSNNLLPHLTFFNAFHLGEIGPAPFPGTTFSALSLSVPFVFGPFSQILKVF